MEIQSKPRYEVLDGLRGVAALIVLLYHHFEIYGFGDPVATNINHGYLAVDFFFILSGYVIGYAYDDRWGKMSLWTFFKRRLCRLHPMIIFSTLFGMAVFYLGSGQFFPLIPSCPVWKLLIAGLLGVLMLPMPIAWDIRGWDEFCPVNGNAWTLYFEYFANILYALVIRRFKTWMLVAFVVASAFLTLNLGMNWDVFGVFGKRTAQAYTMIGGWSLNAQHLTIGFSRLLYPFFMGLLLSRLGCVIRLKGGFWRCAIVLAALMVMPRIGGNAHLAWNGIYECVVVLALFPLVVAAGAGSTVSGRSAAICKWLGEISYPLYIVQYPIVYGIIGSWKVEHPGATLAQTIFVNVSGYLLSVGVAWAALELYDKPIRRRLQCRK